jgi:hypothetical protein
LSVTPFFPFIGKTNPASIATNIARAITTSVRSRRRLQRAIAIVDRTTVFAGVWKGLISKLCKGPVTFVRRSVNLEPKWLRKLRDLRVSVHNVLGSPKTLCGFWRYFQGNVLGRKHLDVLMTTSTRQNILPKIDNKTQRDKETAG